MFERFTERARRVIILAQEEAKRLNHNSVVTGDILLGIIREGEGVASKVLQSLNIPLDRMRADIESAMGGGERSLYEEVVFTSQAKKVLELALDEARRLGHNYIGTEHLLLGLVREGEGVAARVMEAMGADLERVREQVGYALREEGTTAYPKQPSKTPTLPEARPNDLTGPANLQALREAFDRELARAGEGRTDDLTGAKANLRAALLRAFHFPHTGMARTDPLTGLANRRALEEALDRELARAGGHTRPFGLLLVEMDRFKTINDRLGHMAGDRVLKRVAGVLLVCCRNTDLLARYGGDEFVAVLPEASREEALAAAKTILGMVGSLRLPTDIGVTASIGWATFPEDGLTADDLIEAADHAVYRAKARGGNRVDPDS